MATLEETNKNLGALVLVTEKLLESREEEKKDASFFDVPSPSGEPGGMVDSEGNKLVLSKSGNLMQAGADGKATVMSPVGETRKIPNIPSMALPRMGDAGRAGQAEDEAEGTTEPDEEKRNSLLKKMVGFLGDQAKEKGKIAKLGLKGFFGTLIFGGFLIALGQFLQSDTFKKATEFIDKTLIPKLKEFYDAFFGPEGGLFKGIMTLFGDESGIGAIVAGIAGVTALMGVAALKALFSPLTLGLGLFFKGIRLLGRMIPRVPGTPTPPKVPGAPTPPKPPAVATPPKPPAVATPPKPPAVVKPPATVKPPTPAAGGGGVVDKFKHLSKFPLLKKAATKIPLLGPLLSGAFAVQLLLSDASKEEKIKGIGGLLGGGLGAVGFGAVGTALGTVVPGPGNILGGLIGSAIGFFGGEWAGKKLAGFLMGDMVEDEKPKVPGGSSEGKKFNTEPARKQLAAAQDKRMTTSMQLEFMRSQQVVTGETADGIELKGFTGPDAAEKEAQFKDALKADRQAAIEESKAKSQFSFVVSKGKIKNISGLTGDKFNQEELGAKLRFLVGEGVMDDKYAAEQFNGGKTSFEFVAEVNKMYDDLLTQKSKVTPVTGAETTRVMTKSGFKDLTKSEIEEGVKSGEIKRSLGRKAYRRLEMKNRSAGDPESKVTPVTGAETTRAVSETTRVMTKSGFKDLTKSEIEEGVKSGEIKRSLGRKAYRRLEMKNRSAGDPAAQGVTRGSMRLGPNVEPQTADLEAAIAKKLAMSGNTSATAATQQGGGNTQINNVTKKDGDVTHMPKSDIRNNKFAALNRSAYAAGAI